MSHLLKETIIDRQIYTLKPPVNAKYRNYYRCSSDDMEWSDEWESMCNDRCPICRFEIEPYTSEDV